jgi:hypothetical protein
VQPEFKVIPEAQEPRD